MAPTPDSGPSHVSFMVFLSMLSQNDHTFQFLSVFTWLYTVAASVFMTMLRCTCTTLGWNKASTIHTTKSARIKMPNRLRNFILFFGFGCGAKVENCGHMKQRCFLVGHFLNGIYVRSRNPIGYFIRI